MAPDGTPNAGGRDAEHAARRTSSCAFADNVAAAAMRAYDAVLAHLADLDPSRPTERGQTVLAAVVARDARCDPPRLRVVSLGAGTKFLRAVDIDADVRSGTKVRDCHAEVLARRGLKRFLYAQIRSARRRSDIDADDAKANSNALGADAKRRSGESFCERRETPPRDEDEEEWLVLEPVIDVGPEMGWRVRDSVTFHLYASSAPCGNATVKRWARGLKETFDDSLGPFDFPALEHEHDKKHNSFGSVSQGQLAFLWKRDPSESPTDSISDAVPPGTSTRGRLLTCSDKLAVWSCVGVQGALLLARGFLAEPARFASVTVGRKFNRAIGRRALCCRMRSFAFPKRFADLSSKHRNGREDDDENENESNESTQGVRSLVRSNGLNTAHHPTLLCTATPFDAGRYKEGEGADFGSADAVVAWLEELDVSGDGVNKLALTAELLNGRTGERVPLPRIPPREEVSLQKGKDEGNPTSSGVDFAATVSGVSRAALFAAHAACDGSAKSVAEGALDPDAGGSAYAARKAEAGAASGYAEAKREALSQPGIWSLTAPHRHAAT